MGNEIKRIGLIIPMLLVFASIKAAYLYTAVYVHGYWSKWENQTWGWDSSHYNYEFTARKHDYNETFCGLEFRSEYADPWNWCFRISIDNYVKPDSKERKKHDKNNIWYEYSGTVEYYVSEEYPTIEKVLERYKFPNINPTTKTMGRVVKRTAKATIKIASYKKTPRAFNIYFDGCGVGIDWGEKIPFNKKYFVK